MNNLETAAFEYAGAATLVKAFLENIPKEWEEYWMRAFSERLKAFLGEIDNAEGDGA